MDRQKLIALTKTLDQIGVPHGKLGSRYLKLAIEACMEDLGLVNKVTKGLYPQIAKKCDTTPNAVERGIRYVIGQAWKRGNLEVITNIFGYTVDTEKGKPTNSEFIACICDFLNLYDEEIASGVYKF